MTTEDKLLKLTKLADAMYYAAQYLTTDASRLHETMDEYHQFIINEYLQEEPVSKDICNQCEAHNDKDKCDELVFGHKCPIVTTSEDLEEASEEYTGKVLERTNMLIGNQPVGEEIEAAFKAGAQWQK